MTFKPFEPWLRPQLELNHAGYERHVFGPVHLSAAEIVRSITLEAVDQIGFRKSAVVCTVAVPAAEAHIFQSAFLPSDVPLGTYAGGGPTWDQEVSRQRLADLLAANPDSEFARQARGVAEAIVRYGRHTQYVSETNQRIAEAVRHLGSYMPCGPIVLAGEGFVADPSMSLHRQQRWWLVADSGIWAIRANSPMITPPMKPNITVRNKGWLGLVYPANDEASTIIRTRCFPLGWMK